MPYSKIIPMLILNAILSEISFAVDINTNISVNITNPILKFISCQDFSLLQTNSQVEKTSDGVNENKKSSLNEESFYDTHSFFPKKDGYIPCTTTDILVNNQIYSYLDPLSKKKLRKQRSFLSKKLSKAFSKRQLYKLHHMDENYADRVDRQIIETVKSFRNPTIFIVDDSDHNITQWLYDPLRPTNSLPLFRQSGQVTKKEKKIDLFHYWRDHRHSRDWEIISNEIAPCHCAAEIVRRFYPKAYSDNRKYTIDHIQALSLKGDNCIDNLMIVSQDSNSIKNQLEKIIVEELKSCHDFKLTISADIEKCLPIAEKNFDFLAKHLKMTVSFKDRKVLQIFLDPFANVVDSEIEQFSSNLKEFFNLIISGEEEGNAYYFTPERIAAHLTIFHLEKETENNLKLYNYELKKYNKKKEEELLQNPFSLLD